MHTNYFVDSLIIVIALSTFCEYYYGNTYKIYLQAIGKANLVSIINGLLTLISSIVIIVLIKNDGSILMIKLISSIAFIIKPIFYNIYVRKKYKINIKKNQNGYEIKNKRDGLAQHIAWVIFENTDIVILTLFSSLANVSIYSIYSMICIAIRSVVYSMTNGIDSIFGNTIAGGDNKSLKFQFEIYEVAYFTIITIIFALSIILITPFISVYTVNINDIDYVNKTLGILFILSEYIFAVQLPYRSLIHGAGHFKETKIGAWVECILNILISIILVFKLGLIGVIIGTLISLSIRTLEFIVHANKNILKRKVKYSLKIIAAMLFETILIILISKCIPSFLNNSFSNFIVYSLIELMVSMIIVFTINYQIYKNNYKKLYLYLKNFLY